MYVTDYSFDSQNIIKFPLHYFAQHFKMYKDQSRKEKGGEFVSAQVCNASQEALLTGGKYLVWDDCPACLKHGVKCMIAYHRSDQPTGTKIMD